MKLIRCRYHERIFWAEEGEREALVLTAAPYLGGELTGERVPLEEVALLAPCEASKIVAVGKNYLEHIQEMRQDFGDAAPEKPVLFLKPSTCISGPGDKITYPAFSKRVDYEGELAAVVGKRMSQVSEDEALEGIFGYTICNDVTARDIQKSEGQWTRGKAVDGFAPVGPRVVTGLDPAGLEIFTRLNGEMRQHGHTSQFITSLPKLLAFITEAMTLLPGDLVITGTPAGVGPMVPGDVVEVEIPGIGVLENQIVKGED
ncbi:MAG: fumarylacetoacetate hydrolase family protein [Oscillospiraceae bacterium]|jgi:2-keto-4-pentenoate hydratase/2-oxohepta-3-ene-1,7-dioic acid hydratase in catechol pathway|nr:fumarylacetoacetate hydrolase family protein [Oscillospiraceae bacterium]